MERSPDADPNPDPEARPGTGDGPAPETGWRDLQQPEQEIREPSWGPRMFVAGLALLAAVIFVVQNSEPAETRFLFISGEPRLWAVILVSMLLGALLAQAVPALIRHRRRRRQTKAVHHS